MRSGIKSSHFGTVLNCHLTSNLSSGSFFLFGQLTVQILVWLRRLAHCSSVLDYVISLKVQFISSWFITSLYIHCSCYFFNIFHYGCPSFLSAFITHLASGKDFISTWPIGGFFNRSVMATMLASLAYKFCQ